MFNEVSYYGSPKLAWQGREHRGGTLPYAMGAATTDREYPYGRVESPFGTVVESPGFLAPAAAPPVAVPTPATPAAAAPAAGLEGIMGTLTSLPWYVYAAAAYFLFFRGKR